MPSDKNQPTSWRFLFVPWVVLLCGLVLSFVLQEAPRQSARKVLDDEFEFRTAEVVANIERRLQSYEQLLEGASGLFAASSSVERGEFIEYVRALKLEGKYLGIDRPRC